MDIFDERNQIKGASQAILAFWFVCWRAVVERLWAETRKSSTGRSASPEAMWAVLTLLVSAPVLENIFTYADTGWVNFSQPTSQEFPPSSLLTLTDKIGRNGSSVVAICHASFYPPTAIHTPGFAVVNANCFKENVQLASYRYAPGCYRLLPSGLTSRMVNLDSKMS